MTKDDFQYTITSHHTGHSRSEYICLHSSTRQGALRAARHQHLCSLQEAHRASESELRAQIQLLTDAANEREAAVKSVVQDTAEGVDAAFIQLQDTTQALTEARAEKQAQAEEYSELPSFPDRTCAQRSGLYE